MDEVWGKRPSTAWVPGLPVPVPTVKQYLNWTVSGSRGLYARPVLFIQVPEAWTVYLSLGQVIGRLA